MTLRFFERNNYVLSSYPFTQWAAVRIHLLFKMDPPQKWDEEDCPLSDTWYGYLPSGASSPPTILGAAENLFINQFECLFFKYIETPCFPNKVILRYKTAHNTINVRSNA